MQYGTTPIYDACSLLTIADLKPLGMSLAESESVIHGHLDGDVPPEAATAKGAKPVSHCSYKLENWSTLVVNVHQSPFNSAEELTRRPAEEAGEGTTPRVDDDLSSLHWNDDKDLFPGVYIWKPGLLVDVSLRPADPKYGGDTPVATMSCTRRNITPDSLSRELGVAMSVWTDEQVAGKSNDAMCDPKGSYRFRSPVVVPEKVGAGQACLSDEFSGWTFVFQIDRANLTIRGTSAGKTTTADRREQVLSTAQTIAAQGVFR